MKIVERIYEELEIQGKNAADLARHLGVTTGQTTAWKQRKTDPPAKYIAQIAEFLEKSINYILTGAEKTEPVIIPYSGNERIDSIAKEILKTDLTEDDLKLLEFILDKYKK